MSHSAKKIATRSPDGWAISLIFFFCTTSPTSANHVLRRVSLLYMI